MCAGPPYWSGTTANRRRAHSGRGRQHEERRDEQQPDGLQRDHDGHGDEDQEHVVQPPHRHAGRGGALAVERGESELVEEPGQHGAHQHRRDRPDEHVRHPDRKDVPGHATLEVDRSEARDADQRDAEGGGPENAVASAVSEATRPRSRRNATPAASATAPGNGRDREVDAGQEAECQPR